MRPRERRDSGGADLFRARLDQIIDLTHELAKLARAIDWRFLEEKFGAVYTDRPGRPPLPTRLMAGLAILKHTFNLSDEVVCARWVENPYYQYFCGEEFFRHALPFDRSSITRWRNRMGEERLEALLQESLAVATRTGAMKPSDLNRVIVDTTVQPKNITFPTDAKLVNRAREKLVNLADRLGVELSTVRTYLKRIFGKLGVSAEDVATDAVEQARAYLKSSAAVGEHLADQLLLPLALAGGGSFTAASLNTHAKTNMQVIQRFLPVRFDVQEELGFNRVSIQGE